MRKFICLFVIFLNRIAFANAQFFYQQAFQEKEPNHLFDECVNIITGNFVLDDEIIIEGKEPIKLERSYFSLNNFDLRLQKEKCHYEYILAGWSCQNVIKAFFYIDKIDIVQPCGAVFSFQIPDNKKSKKDKKSSLILEYKQTYYLPNFSYNKGRLIEPTDLKVQLKDKNDLVVSYPDGTEKFYKKGSDISNDYLLRKETLSNHNNIEYFYDSLNRLKEIRSTNSNGKKVYAWVKFNYSHTDVEYKDKHKDKYDFSIATSDNKKYEFRYNNYYPVISKKEKADYPFFILDHINSNQGDEKFEYHLDFKRTHPLLKSAVLPNKITKGITYYLLGNKNPEVNVVFEDIKDFRFERVKTLQEPDPVNGSLNTTYRFIYEKASSGKLANTTIYDSNNNKFIYYYNKDFKIEKILRFENINGKHFLANEERFVWERINNVILLVSKVFLDKNSKPVFAKTYSYDSNKNLIEEKIFGNISGNSQELVLDEKNLLRSNCECFSKKYKYSDDKRNLLLEEIDDNNIKVKYSYLSNTNLIESKIISYNNQIKKRYFYEYNEDNHLIREIEDDSSSICKKDTSNLSNRKIKYYILKTTQPFIDYVQAVEEKYLDLKTLEEKLIKKEVFTYSSSGKIIKKDIYDENNNWMYFVSYEYDSKNNLISETDALNNKNVYEFDSKNNKTKKFLSNGLLTVNTYNAANQLLKKEMIKGHEVIKLQYFYDANKNKISFIDDLNNITKYEYDGFFNLTKETVLKVVGDKNCSSEKRYTYDEKGNISQINSDGRITKILYNIYSKPGSITYPDNTRETFIYNLDGTLKIFIDREDLQTHYTYDYLKRIITKKLITESGKILEQEDYKYNSYAKELEENKKQRIKYFYDFAQRLIKKEIVSNADIYTEEYFYDSLSRRNKTIYNNIYAEIIYSDFLNRITGIEKTSLDGLVFYKKEYKYDNLNSLSIISFVDDKKCIEKEIYDCFQRVQKKEDALGNQTIFKYENNFSFLNMAQIKIKNQIDEKSACKPEKIVLLEKKDKSGKVFYQEENHYDVLNNLILKTTTTFIDEKESKRDFYYSYDEMDRLVSCLEKGHDFQRETKYSYTNKGYIKNIIKPDGQIIENKYDDFGNIIKVASSDNKCSYSFEYNNLDLPVKITDLINNSQVIRKYDNFGKLLYEKLPNNLEIKKQYDSFGRKINLIYPDKSSVKYFYDPFYLQKVIRQNPDGQDKYHHEYLKYDLSGNMLQEKFIEDSFSGQKTFLQNSCTIEKNKKYDQCGRIEKIDWEVFWQNDQSDPKYINFDSIFNDKDFLLAPNWQSYDINGNLVYLESDNNKIICSYDALNRLEQIQFNGFIIQFSYDGLNRKITKDVYKLENGNKTYLSGFKYLYDESEIIGSYNDKDEVIDIKILGCQDFDSIKSVAYEIKDEIYVPLYDILGNINSLISLNQELIEVYKYPFWDDILRYSISESIKTFSFDQHLDKKINQDFLFFDSFSYHSVFEKAPMNMLMQNSNLSFLQIHGQINTINEITFYEIALNSSFKRGSFNIFSSILPVHECCYNKENLKVLKDAISFMKQEKISLELLLEGLNKPKDIQKFKDYQFWITYRDFKILIDLKTKEILNVEKFSKN